MWNADALDLAIMSNLEKDASVRRKELAIRLKTSEPTLSKKIGTLTAEGVIRRFTIDLDYARIGLRTHAITLIALVQQSDEALTKVTEALAAIPNAVEIATTIGEWDIFVRWIWPGPDELGAAVREVLHIAPMKIETTVLGESIRRERGPAL